MSFRGTHFEKNYIRFGWVMNISNNFSWGFQKCKFYQRRIHPVDAKLLPTKPTYRLGYRLRGQKWRELGVWAIKKSFCGVWLWPISIQNSKSEKSSSKWNLTCPPLMRGQFRFFLVSMEYETNFVPFFKILLFSCWVIIHKSMQNIILLW